VPKSSTIPLLPLLLRLLDWKNAQDDRDHDELAASRTPFRREVLTRRKKLLDQALARGEVLAAIDAEVQAACEVDNRASRQAGMRMERGEVTLVDRNPWNQALSKLWQALRTPLADARDPAVRFARAYHFSDESTADESSLREYLSRVRREEVEETSLLSAELARLDGEGFGDRLAAELREMFPEEMKGILAGLPAAENDEATPPAINQSLNRVEADWRDAGALQASHGDAGRSASKLVPSTAPRQSGTVNQRMLDELNRNPGSVKWPQRKWANVLCCSPAAVADAAAWQTILTARALAEAQRLEKQERQEAD
jgi:hypothetical protein